MRIGNSTITDSSPSGNDGTCYGTLYVPGIVGSALEFYKSNREYVNVPHDATLNFGTDDFSLCFWTKKNLASHTLRHEAIINKITNTITPNGYGLFLRDTGALWFQDCRAAPPIMTHALPKTVYEYDGTVEEPTNPVMTPTSPWEGVYLCEQNDFKVGAEYRRWYRGSGVAVGSSYVGYATSADGISWTRDPGNPLSFAPTIPDGYTVFPQVIRDGDNFYMFLVDIATRLVYLFNVTDPINPVVMNAGNPVLEPTQDWELGYIYNVGVAIVNGIWHMLYEGGIGSVEPSFQMGYTYSTLAEMNWTVHKSPNNPIIVGAGNPDLIYVPERNALLAIHGSLVTPLWSLMASYASLSSDLNLPASWHQGQILKISLIHETDPCVLVGFNGIYPIMISWIHDQADIYQMYSTLSLTEFYDAVAVPFTLEPWVFLTITRESGVLNLYVNGELEETVGWAGDVTTTQPLVIGKNSYTVATDALAEYLDGIIDEVRIYNQTLTLGEIGTLYSKPASVLNRSLVLCLPLNEGVGVVAYDRSRYHNDGAITGASWVDGIYGKALSFNGTTDYVDCGSGASLNILDAKTISFWIKTTQAAQASLMDKVDSNLPYSGYGIFISRTVAGKLDVYCGESLGWATLNDSIALNDGEWHHIIIITSVATGGVLYVDGEWVQNFGYAATTNNLALTLYIGALKGTSYFFEGILDEVCIDTNVAWTQADITALYEGEAINADCMLYFPFTGIIYEDDDPEAQDYSSFWQELLSEQQKAFGADSVGMIRYALRLRGRDQITGHMTREYEDMGAISMVVLNRNSARTVYTAGYYVRLDALGVTGDVVREGDKIELEDETIYRVASVQPQRAGNVILLWTCDLEELPFKEV